LTNGASLSGFTLTNGSTSSSSTHGGGVLCESAGAAVSNCALTGNFRGGAWYCTLKNCTLSGNSGGGAFYCTLNNCALTGNFGGGAFSSALNNCIVCFNSGGDTYSSSLNNCWTTDPLFVDQASGNLRLQAKSPCINAGNNSYVTSITDLDGNPRVSGGRVDIGAYEYQWPRLTIALPGVPPGGVLLTWPTNNAGYDYTGFTLQSTTNLVSPVVWSTNSPAPVVTAGQNTVTNPITGAQRFYRLVH
jgi:hypothetical protein